MLVTATDSFYLFRQDGLDGPFSPVQLRIMLDRGLIRLDDYCQPESGGATRVLRDIFNDPEAFLATRRSNLTSSSIRDRSLDPFASGTVPLMGDTLPIQALSRGQRPPSSHRNPPTSNLYRASHYPIDPESEVILDASRIDPPETVRPPETVYHGHPSFLSYSRSLFFALIAAVAGALALPLGTAATAAGAGLAFLVLVAVSIHRASSDYLVTTRRVEVITGILSRSSNEVKVSDIRSINVVKKGLLGYLGIGTVEFSSAGGDGIEVRFQNISGTQSVKESVRHLQDSL